MKKHKKKIILKNPKRLLMFFIIIIILFVVIKIKKENRIKNNFELSLLISNDNVIQQLKKEIIIKENTIFISYEDIKKNIDSNIYIEDENILMSSDKKIAVLPINSNKLKINGSMTEIKNKAFKKDNGTIYIPISDLQNVYDIDILYIPDYKNIVIDFYSKKIERAETTKNLSVREKKDNSSLILEKLEKGASVIYIAEQDGWAKIRTQNGNIGFIKKNNLTNFEVQREEFVQENKEIKNVDFEIDITNKNLKKYKNREQVIEQILLDAVNKKQKVVKVIYKNSKKDEKYKRFVIEATAILKESGIIVVAD